LATGLVIVDGNNDERATEKRLENGTAGRVWFRLKPFDSRVWGENIQIAPETY
jgi:hypothetical protein